MSFEQRLKDAQELSSSNPVGAISQFQSLISDTGVNDNELKIKESAIFELAQLYAKQGEATKLIELGRSIKPLFDTLSKAKTAKIVRTMTELLATIPNTQEIQIEECKRNIEWTLQTNRKYLRHRIQTRLTSLYLEAKQYTAALDLVTGLLKEVRKLDDKMLLVEIQLVESSIHLAVRNIAKAKASLTTARTTANAIYCPPSLQTKLDMQSGVLHAEERDYKTSYSYFHESFEGYHSLEDATAEQALKYMLLCKIMMNQASDVDAIITGKLAIKYAGRGIDAMRAVAGAYKARSLEQFEAAKKDYFQELDQDPILKEHLKELYDTLLEQNLCRIIEPYSMVEITHVAELIRLPLQLVERKLSQMILDKKFEGVLDQGAGQLIVFDELQEDQTYEAALETIASMGDVVDSLYDRANKLS